jgi:protein O-GlcNAc transferase
VLIPETHRHYYSEKIVYMPDSYQVNDDLRRISDREFTRAELVLPEKGFVFCCFNANFKITPVEFDIWIRLLREVEGSVLWLLGGNELSQANLTREAEARGMDPSRLVFAAREPMADHLARHRVADLFLDTFCYNAHTTGSDALWAGLPFVTRIGESFASRVGASLLTAVGLQQLITHSNEEYEALILHLARNPGELADHRQRLAETLVKGAPLFDSGKFTRHIENAYEQVLQRYREGLEPDHIHVLD